MLVAIGRALLVMSRAQPPEVALIADLSSEAVNVTGSPVRRNQCHVVCCWRHIIAQRMSVIASRRRLRCGKTSGRKNQSP